MKYPLENLGHERFQQLCQALLGKCYPNVKCFPVGQADGGRDAIVPDNYDESFTIYQVKFVSQPQKRSNHASWLKQTLLAESNKIKNLVDRGATNFILMTNAPGTGSLERGSIDQIDEALNLSIDISSQCWWRDDIERRLDDAWNIKWAFPEVLNNYDIIRMVLEYQDPNNAIRLAQTVKVAIRDQYEREKEVRFKQVNLRNDLFSLFVDVPIGLPKLGEGKSPSSRIVSTLNELSWEYMDPRDHPKSNLGAATVLLNEVCQQELSRVILEGAPGQGKSTIAQYICQIHRHHLLNQSLNDNRVPIQHRKQPVRIPFKIDCRDLDIWLHGENPFPTTYEAIDGQHRSLETFLCSSIQHHSGGSSFSVDDLRALGRLSAMLFVFDGLDEVADVDRRRGVVEGIIKGIARIEEGTLSVQTIVTSRPAAFANSPSFPQDKYTYIQLTSIGRKTIEEYTRRWLDAREIQEREAIEVNNILASKLDQPHMSELSRNPMQLAILLNLIHTRGVSLPDKRTALYDSYVDLFFAREAEKNPVVRDNRDLLIDIHQYLAWKLHSEAQMKRTRGSISQPRLRQLIESYLSTEGHDIELVDQLFSGITERVVALVSRVQGTFEFEVQPLREYFAARHLYNTAPYSPAGREKKGTLPERFDALSRDFFWQNVTRFYAGCYNKGEIASLVQSLKELSDSEGYSLTGHPRRLAAALLSDWTFAQYPNLMKDVVSLVVDGVSLRILLTPGNYRFVRKTSFVLPEKSGKEELISKSFELLIDGVPEDYASDLLDLIHENSESTDAFSNWILGVDALEGSRLTEWIAYGERLNVLNLLNKDQKNYIVNENQEMGGKRLLLLLDGGTHLKTLQPKQFNKMIDWMLNESNILTFHYWKEDEIGKLGKSLSPMAFAYMFRWPGEATLSNFWQEHFPQRSNHESYVNTELPNTPFARSCLQYSSDCFELANSYTIGQWGKNLLPWSLLVESGRSKFGNRWVFYLFAFLASGVKSGNDKCNDASDFFDDKLDLCRRARFARLKAGNASWWGRTLQFDTDNENRLFSLLLFFTWSGPKAMSKLAKTADKLVNDLPDNMWEKLHMSVRAYRRIWASSSPTRIEIDSKNYPSELTPKFVVLLANRAKNRSLKNLYSKYLQNYNGDDLAVLRFCLETVLRLAIIEKNSWHKWLPLISSYYAKGAIIDHYFTIDYDLDYHWSGASWGVNKSTAEEIMKNCDMYPAILVTIAEQVCRSDVAKKIEPVGNVAARDNWFN